jgi:glycosyltransferase involved in cell wall biosynthesis
MKLLILTQKVDIDDPILGFFHRWIEEFVKRCQNVTVICLQKGEYHLPENVKVLSLGKEKYLRYSHIIRRLVSLYRFYKYIWQERKNYDAVFVHMNQEYIILGGFLWRFLGKKIAFWYNHQHGNLITKLVSIIANLVFYTSPFAFTSRFKNAKIMPAGIDTELFKKNENIQKISNSILYLGRISPVKNVDVLIEAAKLLDKEGTDFILNIVGEAGEKDKEYFEEIKKISKSLEESGKIKFWGVIPNYKTPEIYNQNEVFINLSPSGLFDKTILEAMSCETITIVSSKAFQGVLPDFLIFKENDAKDLKDKINGMLNRTKEEKREICKKIRKYVVENHNLDILIDKIIMFLNK